MLAALLRAGVDIRPEAMGVTWDDVAEAMRTLPAYVRDAGLWYSRRRRRCRSTRRSSSRRQAGIEADVRPVERRHEAMSSASRCPRAATASTSALEAETAWQRTVEVAQRAEEVGLRLALGRTTTSRSIPRR